MLILLISRSHCRKAFPFADFPPCMIGSLRDSLLSVIYPQKCNLCEDLVNSLSNGCVCEKCWSQTRFFTGLETLCLKCGALLSDAEPLFDTYCHQCDESAFDTANAVGPYQNGIMASVIFLKSTPRLPAKLRIEAGRLYKDKFADKEMLIVPVPLSAKRRLERGFNQAEVIAAELSKELGLPADIYSLIRIAHTPTHRAAMDKKAREATVRNVFDVKRRHLMKGKDILLVDDVLTSGATASACAKALKESGAASVNVLTLGRAVLVP